ncbi:hypothetical protein PLESTF_001011700 [Pleodorina starrii]|nr:hypothetical protein PLESTM_001087000 [Pleodorina starrii]GLC70588.1 hypothetical protein PLESTF_001011700 [Pleodorina starrii]
MARPRALVVDDLAVNRLILGTILQKLGFEVLEAENGLQCIDVYNQERTQLVCVFLDLQMPVADGWAATKGIRELESLAPDSDLLPVPVVVCTASCLDDIADNGQTVAQRAVSLGANGAVRKPLTVYAVQRILDEYAPRWRSSRDGADPDPPVPPAKETNTPSHRTITTTTTTTTTAAAPPAVSHSCKGPNPHPLCTSSWQLQRHHSQRPACQALSASSGSSLAAAAALEKQQQQQQQGNGGGGPMWFNAERCRGAPSVAAAAAAAAATGVTKEGPRPRTGLTCGWTVLGSAACGYCCYCCGGSSSSGGGSGRFCGDMSYNGSGGGGGVAQIGTAPMPAAVCRPQRARSCEISWLAAAAPAGVSVAAAVAGGGVTPVVAVMPHPVAIAVAVTAAGQ